MDQALDFISHSVTQTQRIGARLGELALPGDVFLLEGELGSGKTCLTQGIARGLGINGFVSSPTFTLIHEHRGPVPLYHVDLYRIEGDADVESTGVEEYLQADGVTVIEWAEKMRSMLPPDRLDITLRMTGETTREITFEGDSPRMRSVLNDLEAQSSSF